MQSPFEFQRRVETIRENVSHIARGCRSSTSHNPAPYLNTIEAALTSLLSDAGKMERAYAQACTNLAVVRPGGRDLSIGEIADLYRDALLAGWGGIEGWRE